jgi:hypothetical protein
MNPARFICYSVWPQHRVFFLLIALLALGPRIGAAADGDTKSFSLTAGSAPQTLKQFAEQSGRGVVFVTEVVKDVRTNAVQGELTPAAALRQLLEGTALVAEEDRKTGAFAVRKGAADPKGARAAPLGETNNDPARSTKTSQEDSVIALSPFVIDATKETGWVATQTLGGSRMKTDFKDLAQPMEVMTMDFMRDLGVNSFEQALIYSTNVEGRDEFVDEGFHSVGVAQLRTVNRVRGLIGATLSRNFFEAGMPTDNYNLDRITIARGPNAILFGLGSPSGIVDASLQRANLQRRSLSTELQYSSEDSRRSVLNFNQPIFKGKLALRTALLSEESQTFSKPNLDRQDRYYGAITAQPFKHTTISVHGEKVERFNNRAARITPIDNISLWENASSAPGGFYSSNRPLFDNRVTGSSNPGNFNLGNVANNPIFGRLSNALVWLFNAGPNLEGTFGNRENTVEARQPTGIPAALNPYDALDRLSFTLGDERVTSFDTNLAGMSRGQKQRSDLYNVFVEQRLAPDLHLELAYNKEDLDVISADSGFGGNFVYVDANLYLPNSTTPNPNAGRYYIDRQALGGFTSENREDWRATLSYEFDFGRRFGSNRILKWLGRNRFAVLGSGSEFKSLGMQINRGILDQTPSVPGSTFPTGSFGSPTGTGTRNWASDNSRTVRTRFYLGGPAGNYAFHPFGDLFGTWRFTDAAGRPMSAYLFDSPYKNSEGWKLVRNPNGAEGSRTSVQTQMLAWQNYLLKDRLVLLFGYRKDTAKSASIDPRFLVRDWSGLVPSAEVAGFGAWGASQSGVTRTYGAVFHLTPWASLTYNLSDTFQPNIGRFDPFGREYAGASGLADDAGLSLGLFGGKLIARASYFTNTAGPTRADNQGFNDPLRDQLFTVDNAMRTLDPQLSVIGAGTGGFREKGQANYLVMFDSKAKGYELDLSWLPNRNWSFKANAATQKSTESNIGTAWFEWIAARLPVWQSLKVPEGGRANPRDVDGNGTIGTWTWATAPFDGTNPASKSFERYYAEDIGNSLAFIRAVDGRDRSQGRDLRWNFIADYKFTEGRLRGLGANLAFRYRAAPNLGYGLKKLPNGTSAFDLDQKLEGKDEFKTDLGLNYRGTAKYFGGVKYRVQLNVRNVLEPDKIVPTRVLSTGRYIAWARVEPRLYVFTVGFDL